MHHVDADKTYIEKARREEYKNYMSYIEEILEATPHETTIQIRRIGHARHCMSGSSNLDSFRDRW